MYHALSDAVRIARDMADGAAAGAMQVEHDQGKMDRNAFHRALVQALSDPYTISGRATAKNLQQLEKAQ